MRSRERSERRRTGDSEFDGRRPREDRPQGFDIVERDADWRQKVKRPVLVNLSILLASVFLCALLLEVVSRLLFEAPPSVVIGNLADPGASIDPPEENQNVTLRDGRIYSQGVPDSGFYIHTPTGRRLRPGVSGAITGHHLSRTDVEFSTNSFGFRDAEIGEKGERDYRILVLGDSITLGDYAKADETYPAVIQRLLGEPSSPVLDGRNVRVINAGVGAIDLQNEFAILMEAGLLVEPDVVLVGLYLNDAYHSQVLKLTRLSPTLSWSHFLRVASMWLDVFRDQYVYEGAGLRDEDAVERERKRFLDAHSAAEGDWHTSREAFDAMIADQMGDWGYAWSEDYWQKALPILGLMKQVGNERGFQVAVMLFPVSYQVHTDLIVDEPQQSFERHMTELGLAHLDLLPLLREKYERDGVNVFYDHCHYRPDGYEYLSGFAADFLLNEVISR